jgi:hypothetical protein
MPPAKNSQNLPPDQLFSTDMRQRFIDFYQGWMSDDGQAFLAKNRSAFDLIALHIRENRASLERWCARELKEPSGDELNFDAVSELICLEHSLRQSS